MAPNNRYAAKVVVITGAASGFGKRTAIELARRGSLIVLASRNVGALQEVAAECRFEGAKTLIVATDVRDRASVENLAWQTNAHYGHFDVWINDVGVDSIGQFHEVSLDDHEQVIRAELIGTIVGSYCALSHFRKRGAGTLINVASVIGTIPAPLYASYTAAKFGIVGLSDALRQELRQDKIDTIRVCTVMPMAHDTEFMEHAGNDTGREAVPIPATYDPQVTVDALVKLVVEPEDEVITGWPGNVDSFFHRLLPQAHK